MQISLTHTNDTEVKLTIVANEAELLSMKDHVLTHFQRKAKIAGFREGKAPLAMVEKNVDPEALQAEFLDEALNQMYGQAIQQEKLRPVANPQVSLKKFVPFTTLEFEAEVPVVGKVSVADYKNMKKPKPEVKITADDIKEVISALQKRVAEKKAVDRACKAGDEVLIDFKGVNEKGEAVNGAEGKEYPLSLGSNTFIPGFEDNVIGMKPAEEKVFTLKFPKDYGVKALAGKNVTFTVTVTKVQELQLAKVDDAFAAQAGPFKTLQELKDDIKKQLQTERQQEADVAYENELIRDITAKSKVALPKILIDEQIDRIEEEEKQNLTYRGQSWQEHLDEEGVTAEEHREQKRAAAEERVKASFILAEIAQEEKLDVTTEELDVRMQILRSQYQDKAMQAELAKPDTRRDIASRILTEKTVNKLKDYASGTKA